MRAISYAAVSTPDQATEARESIPAQLAESRAACDSYGWQIVQEIVVPGHSRNYLFLHELLADCPEYAALVAAIESGGIDLVVARDWKRLARTADLSNDLDRLLRYHGVQVYLHAQPELPVDPDLYRQRDHTTERIVRFFRGYESEMDNRTRTHQLQQGMRGRIRKGLHGTGYAPFGYRPDGPARPFVADRVTAPWLRWLFDRRAEGRGYTWLAMQLIARAVPTVRGYARWTAPAVAAILHNRYFAGVVHHGALLNPDGLHERIIPPDLWARVQEVNRRRHRVKTQNLHPLSGLLTCGYCGSAMAHQVAEGRYRVRCSRYVRSFGRECQSNGHRACPIEVRVFEAVHALLLDPSTYETYCQEREGAEDSALRLGRIEIGLGGLRAEHNRLTEGYLRGFISIDAMEAHAARLTTQTQALEAERETLVAWQATVEVMRRRLTELSATADEMGTMDVPALNALYHALIEHVIIRRDARPLIVWQGG